MEESNKLSGINAEKIEEQIREFITNNFLLATRASSLNNDDSFFEKGIIDSTGVLELVSFIEETFDIKVANEELIPDNLDSLNKIVPFIKRKKGNAG